MADNTTLEKLQEIKENTAGSVEKLITLTLEAEVDHRAGEQLREEIKKWVTSIKADSLIHFSLHMIGFGSRFVFDLKDKLAQAGNNINPEKKIQLQEGVEDSEQRVSSIARLALEAERSAGTAEDLREEIRKWIDSVAPETLSHFATHMIGTGVVFANFVNQKIGEIPA